MGESRHELLAWLNNLLQLNITKVEQCGTGAALCQVFDSIFLDVPMSKVKFNATGEYAYIQNFKVLQNTFTRHQIDRTIPVEALAKCKMQDNLEFLQWSKRYWDQYFPGDDYDPIARRRASGAPSASSPLRASSASNSRGPTHTTTSTAAARRPAPISNTAVSRTPRVSTNNHSSSTSSVGSAVLQSQIAELKEQAVGLEREKNFYFNKLRDIEVLLQQEFEQKPELEKEPDGVLGRIQVILYSTEDGFEIPQEDEEELEGGEGPLAVGAGEEETF